MMSKPEDLEPNTRCFRDEREVPLDNMPSACQGLSDPATLHETRLGKALNIGIAPEP